MQKGVEHVDLKNDSAQIIEKLYGKVQPAGNNPGDSSKTIDMKDDSSNHIQDTEEIVEESLSLTDKEVELIKKALDKHAGKRKYAANELGISERTLYRKIKEYNLESL